jgi:heme oxygenase
MSDRLEILKKGNARFVVRHPTMTAQTYEFRTLADAKTFLWTYERNFDDLFLTRGI